MIKYLKHTQTVTADENDATELTLIYNDKLYKLTNGFSNGWIKRFHICEKLVACIFSGGELSTTSQTRLSQYSTVLDCWKFSPCALNTSYVWILELNWTSYLQQVQIAIMISKGSFSIWTLCKGYFTGKLETASQLSSILCNLNVTSSSRISKSINAVCHGHKFSLKICWCGI